MTLPTRLPRKQNRTERWKSQSHCSFVRSHRCCVPGCLGMPIEVAHVRLGSDGGLARKPSDFFTVSMCRDHHTEQHGLGEASFQNKHGVDLLKLADEFSRASPKWPEIRARRDMAND